MLFKLPALGQKNLDFPHFPTRMQLFIFRAYEYVSCKKIADVLRTSEENVIKAAEDMGLKVPQTSDIWMKKGYITIIRRMWHVLPYDQLLQLLEMDEETLARVLRDDDFLEIKLGDKPICEPVVWEELNEEQVKATERIKFIMDGISTEGIDPFDFKYEVPEINFQGKEFFKTRMIYAFSGLYQHAFDVDSREYLPDEMLEAYQKLGINGIWTQGILSQLTEFPFEPQISKGYEARIARMNQLCDRLEKYGIKLFLYLNEPRSMPSEFFNEFPHLKGHVQDEENVCLCTSTPEVRDYLRNSVASLCKAVPKIGGFFTINRSENLTNCYSRAPLWGLDVDCNCPRCKNRSVGEVIGETVACISEGAHSVNPDIKVMAWSWSYEDFCEDIIRHLPKDVIFLSQSELHIPYNIGGVDGFVKDYSMSIIGPGEQAKKEWEIAKECGLEIGAKVQINTTWEASSVPALPVFPSIEQHIEGVRNEGVEHLILSWTLGGYPCANIAHAAKYFYENAAIENESEAVKNAAQIFVEAFKEFPFHIDVVYNGPQNAGPSTLLYLEPTGFKATMTGFAYDDLESWRVNYPKEVFENQFGKLCEKWEKGLQLLANEPETETAMMAYAAYCLFKASHNQIRFIMAREDGNKAKMRELAKAELSVAEKMLELMNKNAAIGFEASSHYYFSKGQIAEKILNCHHCIAKLTDSKESN